MKSYLNTDEQIEKLSNKNVAIVDKQILRSYLSKNSYYTFIGGTKMYFVIDVCQGKKIYCESNSTDWISKFENLKLQAMHLLKFLLDYELMVVTEFIEVICKKQVRGENIEKLLQSCLVQINKWQGSNVQFDQLENEPWRYLNNMSFGSLISIIREFDYGNEKRITQYMSKTITLNNMGTCRILRNGISHNTPLSVLFNDRRDFQKRKNFVLELYKLNNSANKEILEIINSAEKYNKITR